MTSVAREATIHEMGKKGGQADLPALLPRRGPTSWLFSPMTRALRTGATTTARRRLWQRRRVSSRHGKHRSINYCRAHARQSVVLQRQIAATPALIKALDDSDATVRQIALAALGETVELKDLDVLISLVTSPKNAEDTATAVKALRTACVRMPDGDACAGKLVGAMSRAPMETKCTILDILGAMGGPKALQAIAVAGKDASPELQDTATRLLGEWMNVDAGPVLLDLAQNAPVEKYRIRAIRGYIRLVRQFNMPAAQRAQMCAKALNAAQRTTEKKLVLKEVIGLDKYASPEMLQLALEAKKDPALKDDATRISAAIAKKLGRN